MYDRTLPENNEATELETKDINGNDSKTRLGTVKRKKWVLGVVLSVALAFSALTAGLGAGLSLHNPLHAPGPTNFTIRSNSSEDLRHAIMNDTSLATIFTPDGNRHVIFQDRSGLLREAINVASESRWLAQTSFVIATDARNYTPLSTAYAPRTWFSGLPPSSDSVRSLIELLSRIFPLTVCILRFISFT